MKPNQEALLLDRLPIWKAAVIIGFLYYCGAQAGLALSFMPSFIAPLWPPNAILLAALFLIHPKKWVYILLAAVPAEIAADVPYGVDLGTSLGFVASDGIEVLTAAFLIRKADKEATLSLSSLRGAFFFITCCVIIGPFVAAFPGAAVTSMNGGSAAYWLRWRHWFVGDALTHLTITPFLYLWATYEYKYLKKTPPARLAEIAVFGVALFFASHAVMSSKASDIGFFPAVAYAPMPLLLWISVRFGTYGYFSTGFFITLFGIRQAVIGEGPFTHLTTDENVLNLQLFLFTALTPFMFLASLIAERKVHLNALKISETTLADLYDNAPDLYLTIAMNDYRIRQCNRAVAEKTGMACDHVIGKLFFDLLHADSRQDAVTIFDLFKNSGEIKNAELKLLQKDGGCINCILNATPIRDRRGRIILCRAILRDITERKLIKAQLKEHYKMDAIGTFAGGIAHQFNNLLSVITGNAELLTLTDPTRERILRYVGPMQSAVQRMHQLTDQLLAYAQSGQYHQRRRIPLNLFIREALALIAPTINKRISVRTDMAEGDAYIEADTARLQMALAAILSNAAEATDENGRIEIIGGVVSAQPGSSLAKHARYAQIRIMDNGKGMDAKTRKRLFEPFFSTKFQGRGLGMAAAYGIVQSHDGWIDVTSEVGCGTTVTLNLPLPEAEEPAPPPPLSEKETRKLNILLVEDEQMVLNVHLAMLNRLGHAVQIARNGAEAIAFGQTSDPPVDLVLLDIVLPDISGKNVFMELKQSQPELKVIVCSGYSEDGPVRDTLALGADGFLQKPFNLRELSSKITSVMD